MPFPAHTAPVLTTAPRRPLLRHPVVLASCALASAAVVVVGGLAAAPPAAAATNVDYTVTKVMGVGDSQIHAPTPGTAATSAYGGGEDLALDAAGNLYVADGANDVVEKITPGGTLSVVAGGHGTYGSSTPALSATLSHPRSIALDGSGNMYVALSGSSTIVKIVMATGAISTVAGTGNYTSTSTGLPTLGAVATTTDFGDINDLAVDSAGNLYIADDANSIERIDHATGVVTQVAGTTAGWNATGSYPTSTPTTALGAYIMGASDLAFAPDGSLLFSTTNGGTNASLVFRITPDGQLRRIAGTGTAADAVDGSALSSPLMEATSLVVDPAGNAYIGTWHQVVQIDTAGDLESVAGIRNSSNSTPATFGTASTSSTLFEVDGLALSPDGSIYLDNGSPRYVEKLTNVQPGLPRSAAAVAGDATATASWSAASAGSGGAVTGYTVTPYAAGVAQSPVSVSSSTTSRAFTGLTNGTAYTFRVAATYSSGAGDPAVTLPVTPSAAPSGGGGGGLSPLLPQSLDVTAPASVSLAAGSTRVTAVASAGGALTYSSSNPSVATTDGSGTLTLRSTGTTSITVTAAATATHAGVATTVTLTVTAPVTTTLPTGAVRLSGGDRVATAVAVSAQVFPDPDAGKSANVVIATSSTYADSIAGARLAGQVDGPLLLTGTDQLDSAVAAEVRRLVRKGGTVYILGQDKALSTTVQAALESLSSDYPVQRLGGGDRYETAVKTADAVTARAGDVGPIYLVTGRDFADGVSVGAFAERTGGVVLLTDGDRLPAATAAYLKAHDPDGTRTVPVGGAAAAAAKAAGYTAAAGRAVVGADRFATSAKLADIFAGLKTAANSTGKVVTVGVAGGASWPDALAGSAAMSHLDGPLLLTPTGSGQLSGATSSALKGLTADADRAVVFGGPSAVSDTALGQIKGLIG